MILEKIVLEKICSLERSDLFSISQKTNLLEALIGFAPWDWTPEIGSLGRFRRLQGIGSQGNLLEDLNLLLNLLEDLKKV